VNDSPLHLIARGRDAGKTFISGKSKKTSAESLMASWFGLACGVTVSIANSLEQFPKKKSRWTREIWDPNHLDTNNTYSIISFPSLGPVSLKDPGLAKSCQSTPGPRRTGERFLCEAHGLITFEVIIGVPHKFRNFMLARKSI